MNSFFRMLFRRTSTTDEEMKKIPGFDVVSEVFFASFKGREKARVCDFAGDEFMEVVVFKIPARERGIEGLIIGYNMEDPSQMICVNQSTGNTFTTSVSLDGDYEFCDLDLSFLDFIAKCGISPEVTV